MLISRITGLILLLSLSSCHFIIDFEEWSYDECGNSIDDEGEECDHGGDPTAKYDCTVVDYHGGGTLRCNEDCQWDISECVGGEFCGNGTIDVHEECDGEELIETTCEMLGLSGGEMTCTKFCRFDPSGCDGVQQCGNGFIDELEECDGNIFGGVTCESLGYPEGELGCDENCRFFLDNCVLECPLPGADGTICINGNIKYFIDPNDPTKFLNSEIKNPSLLNSMELYVYDPLDYAASGSQSAPLGIGTISPSGAFMVTDITVPSMGYVALIIRDKGWTEDLTPVNWLVTGMSYRASSGFNLENKTAFAVTAGQLDEWHAELPDGFINGACPQEDIYGCGTWIGIYRDPSPTTFTPIDGVTPYYKTSFTIPSDSIAFLNKTDSGEYTQLTTGTDQNSTSETGTVFYFGAQLTTYYGLCDFDDGSSCNMWQMEFPQNNQSGSAAGSIFIQYVDGSRLNK
jgi:hypothetical protein